MFTHRLQLVAALLLPSIALATPVDLPHGTQADKVVHARVDPAPSSYPYGVAVAGEWQYLGWDPKNDEQKERAVHIHQAFIEWKDMAKAAAAESTKYDSAIVKRWFNKQDDQSEQKAVFANMWDASKDAPAAPVAGMVCEQTDFKKACGANTQAYTIEDTGHFHVCPPGDKRQLNSEIKCADLDASCSRKMRSLPMTILHEMTHVGKIGTDGHAGITITDEAGGAYDCFKLDTDSKGDNAQNYAWFAGDVYWGQQCSKTFEDPGTGVKAAVGEDIGPPSIDGYDSAQCSGSTKFNADEAKTAINNFCNDPNLPPTVIVPLVSVGSGQTSDGRGKALGNSNEGIAINGGANLLWLGASFQEEDCVGSYQFGGDSCVAQLNKIVDQCPGDVTAKTGGWIDNVCAVYRILVTEPGDPSPLYIQAVDEDTSTWTWTCEATDTSALGPNSGLDGTCTCQYNEQPGLTDIFLPPSGGDCAKVPRGAVPKSD